MATSPSSPPIGAHTSTAGGLEKSLQRAHEIGADLVQLFTRNQRQWNAPSILKEEAELFQQVRKDMGIRVLVSHDSYLINLGSPKDELLHKSHIAFQNEIQRCLALGIDFINFHPGTATDGNREASLNRIISFLKELDLDSSKLRLLIETTAGQGQTLGSTFEEVGYLVQQLLPHIPIGVCIDTCHIFAAGYDLRTKSTLLETVDRFDQLIGLSHLYLIHMNDSLRPLGSHVDRHASLGKGMIGSDAFELLMQLPSLKEIPKCLETPDPDEWASEITLLKHYYSQGELR